VAHYPDRLARRLRDRGLDTIHSVVLWTKDTRNLLSHRPLREALLEVGQVFLHWTVTGLGGTFLEPNVPAADDQLALLDDVVAFLGDPRRLHWRYDPLIAARRERERSGNTDLDLFRSLAARFAEAGVPAVHTSFVSLYPKVVRRLAAEGIQVDALDADGQQRFLGELAEAARERGMALLTCSQPGLPRQRCIDGELLIQLHPAGEPCRTDRARGQRDLCGCTASLDVGHYLPCPSRCLYCYAHPAGRSRTGAPPSPQELSRSRRRGGASVESAAIEGT